MNVEFITNGFEATESMKEANNNLVEEVKKYFKLVPTSMRIDVKKVRGKFKIESMIFFKNKQFIRQEIIAVDYYEGLKGLKKKLEEQLKKLKSKIVDNKINMNHKDVFSELVKMEKNVDSNRINRRKVLELKPTSEEEAILQLVAVNHSFYVFRDLEDNYKILYKKGHGYGILELNL